MGIRSGRLFGCALLLFSLILSGQAVAAAPTGQGAPKKIPTTITSGRMDYDANGQTVVFLGDVHVKRPDFELWSEKMTVYLDKSNKQSSSEGQTAGMEAGNIDHIVAEKNVRLKSENNSGTCDKATYYAKEDKFVMEGNPILRDNKQSTVKGSTIIHYLSTNRSQVMRGTATFYSEDRTEGGNSAPAPKMPGTGLTNNGGAKR